MIITEYELRANWHKTKDKVITIPPGSVITPAARDFLRQKGIQVQVEGDGMLDLNKINYSTSRQSMMETAENIEPKHRTFRQEPIFYPSVREGRALRQGAVYQPPVGRQSTVARIEQATDVPKTETVKEMHISEQPPVQQVPAVQQEIAVPQVPPVQQAPVVEKPPVIQQTHDGKQPKPEHMTHLHGNVLVTKTHPIIALRGQLDLFDCALAEVEILCEQHGERELVGHLEEIAQFARDLMVAEVRQEPFKFTTLIGLNPDELREHSHHPQKYYGVKHMPISYKHGLIVAKLHQLRAKAREAELYANRAFTDENGYCSRTDIVQALNRLSSAFYILACQVMAKQNQEKRVPIGVSNRHVHLSQEHLEILFGPGYQLTVMKDLSQPGQFAAKETVNIVGPKGSIEKVRVLGPVRKESQIEVSGTDCFKLGVRPVVRDSGELDGTDGITLVGPAGEVKADKGVIVASRHIHLHTDQANAWGLKDKQRVRVRVDGNRPVVFEDVLVRVSPNYEMEMHVDTDEANAVLMGNENYGVLLGV